MRTYALLAPSRHEAQLFACQSHQPRGLVDAQLVGADGRGETLRLVRSFTTLSRSSK